MLPRRSALDGFVWTPQWVVPPASQSGVCVSPNNRYANEPALKTLEKTGLAAGRAQRPSAPRLSPVGFVLTLVVMGCLPAASVLPVVKFPGDAGNYLGHLAAYGLATGCLVVIARLRAWLAALMLFAFGVAIELVQPYVGREAHVEDVLANTAGIVVTWCAVALWRRVSMRRHLASTRVDW